jgi:Mycothiol maleylpyruvate isomerase N-terminal domain
VIDLAPPHLWLRSPVELLRVDTVDLLPDVRAGLVALLRDLDPADWDRDTACPGWTVADVARHLLGVELGNVSRRRDGHRVDPPPGADLPSWLDGLNEGWVRAARLLSARVIADLLDVAGAWFEAHAAGLDLDAAGPPVWWVGPEPAPVWLDVAREYTERWGAPAADSGRHRTSRPRRCAVRRARDRHVRACAAAVAGRRRRRPRGPGRAGGHG